MILSSIQATSTAFLLQSEAFIGSPPNPAPGQDGAGVWVRGVGGQVDVKSSASGTGSVTVGGAVVGSGPVSCTEKVDEDFAGVQFGSDVAKLNMNGWNFHLGTTAGYLGSRGSMSGGALSFIDPVSGAPAGGGAFDSTTQVPFFGGYVALTNGGFFVDGLLREEYYQTTLNSAGLNLFGQQIDAHGWSFSASAGYNWSVPNSNWFIEPSGTFIVSRTTVDPLAFSEAGASSGFDQLPASLTFNQIRSDIGRVGVRAGTTIDAGSVVWQPFGAVSVWHEFGPDMTGSFTTTPGCCFLGATPASLSGTGSISTIGTFGQYSLGISGALTGTGWLGFARVDYRDGSQLEGLSGTGGIRYQFAPSAPVVMPIKTKAAPAPIVTAVNWTGWYVGGFGGANLGQADWGYSGGSVSPHIGGFAGGGDLGYNWQTGKWVLGVEGDLEGTNTKGSTACNSNATIPPSVMLLTSCNASADWIGTVTGRIGYAWWDRAMVYVKAGGAWTEEKFSASCNNYSGALLAYPCAGPSGSPTTGFSANNDRGGWTVGYGGEFALTSNWAAKAETDYVGFGDRSITATNGGGVLNLGMHLWETKIGVNYHFGTM
jgi:opacity protein-like surface antigen